MSEDTKTEKATVYEVGFHIVPTVSPENLGKEVDAIKAILRNVGAKIISEEAPKMMNLAYEMLKVVGPKRDYFETAYFGWIKFESEPKAAVELKKALDISEKVLRFIIVKTIRENTMHGHKFVKEGASTTRRVASTDASLQAGKKSEDVKAETTPEELDKSIDKLVIE